MQKFKTVAASRPAAFIGGVILALVVIWPLMGTAQDKSDKAKDPDQHAKHNDKQPPGDQNLSSQFAELRAKVGRLEAALAKSAPPMAADAAKGMGKGNMTPGSGMPGTTGGATPPPAMAGMSGAAAPAGGAMNMMGMMDKMMGMMDKMMSMGGSMPAGAPMAGGGMGMGMGMMKKEMGGMGGGAMPAGVPAAGMASGGSGMGMDKMEMAGMMGMGAMSSGASGAMPQSVLPGFPGASHLYHIGATDFFLDHPQHIALTTEQQAGLNKAKEQALLAKGTADRSIKQAEQDLWTLTAADQPDAAKIEAKIAEIGKLTGDARLAFIRAVGEASKLLTVQQRKILTGFAPPVSAVPAAAPMAGAMQDM